MSVLLPDQLKQMWTSVQHDQLDYQAFSSEQDRLLDQYRRRWSEALLLGDNPQLEDSILAELALYTECSDLDEVRERCKRGAESVAHDWETLGPEDEKSIEGFYDRSTSYIYDLMWWHTLSDDTSPLGYVNALEFAEQRGCHLHLDFGAGVGSGNLLFLRNGFESTYADISSSLTRFSEWRFQIRKLSATAFIDVKTASLPSEAFDVVTAMDVFEHLVDPPATVEMLWKALKPGGYLFGRFAPDTEENRRPQHIVEDFAPTMERMRALDFVEIWRDEWLWGNQVFQKG